MYLARAIQHYTVRQKIQAYFQTLQLSLFLDIERSKNIPIKLIQSRIRKLSLPMFDAKNANKMQTYGKNDVIRPHISAWFQYQ